MVQKFLEKLKNNKKFRREVGLYLGAAVNFFFVGFELYGGIRYQSAWFTSLALYYLVLTVVKFYIGVAAHKKSESSQWRTLKIAGSVMVVMNLALMVMISIMIARPEIALHRYGAVVAIAMATWTFYLFISAITGLVKLKGKDDAWALTGAIVKLAGAIVAVLMLQTTMIASFGTGSGEDLIGGAASVIDKAGEVVPLPVSGEVLLSEKTLNFLTGANRATGIAVGAAVMGLTFYMIARGAREEKRQS